MNSKLPFYRTRFKVLTTTVAYLLPLFLLNQSLVQAATKYWDTTAGSGNGVGGTGIWGSSFSTTSTGDASLTTAATTDDDIFQGTAGTITLGASQTANTLTFNTTGYKITGNSTANRVLTGGITLGSSVNLTIGNGETTDIAVGVGSISGATGTLTINGAATGTAVTRLNLASASANISVPITVTGTGFANITGTATGTQVTGTVTGNGSRLNLGATSGNAITFTQKIDNGSGTVRIGAGSSGGAGVTTLSGSGNTWGTTELNNATSAILRMGAVNALPTATTLTFGATAGNGDSNVELNGKNTTIGQLTNGVLSGGILRNTSSTAATLTISGSDTGAAAFSGSLQDGTGGGALSLVRSGTGTTTLSGSNSYTGTTQINGGTLNVSGSITGTGAVSLTNANSTLITGSATTIGGAITANNGTILTIGGAGTVGTLTSGALTLNGGSTLNFDLVSSSSYDNIISSGALTLGTGTETINLAGSSFTTGTYTLLSGYSSLAGSGAFALGSTPSGFNFSLSTGATSTVLTVSSLGGSGGNLTWSPNGLAPTSSTDGSGTWTNGGPTFYNTSASAQTTWDNTAGNNLTIGSGGSGGTITLGGNVRVGGTLTLAAVSSPYVLGASGDTNTLTLVGGITANNSAILNAPTVLEASQSWNVSTGMLTANGLISETGGAAALTKSGAGTLVLANASNSYSGGTVLGGGIVSVSSNVNLGSTSGGLTFSGGTLQTSAGITSSRSVTVGSSGGTFDSNGFDSTLNGNITGSGTLNKNGAGSLTLTGTNTFTAAVVNAGTLNNNGSYTGATTLAGGTLGVGSSGSVTVSGSTIAVSVTGNNATITNLGTINQTGTGRAIRDTTVGGVTGLVINNGSATNSTALMQTKSADVIQMPVATSSVMLNNYGTMTSLNTAAGGSQAVDFNAVTGSNTVNNYSTGIMQAAEADAVRPGVNGVVNNAGLIKSTWATTSSGSSSDGVDAQNNSGVVITNASNWSAGSPSTPGSGTIEGARDGITGGALNSTVTFTTSVTNNLGGIIKGNNGSGINLDGFNANQTATIVNNGTITGNGRDIGNNLSHDGDGVDVDGLVNVTNTGIIRSINSFNIAADGVAHSEGITVGGGTIINSGTIEGLVASGNTNAIGYGITLLGNDITTGALAGGREALYADSTITNQSGGLIRGDSASGIAMLGSTASGHTVTINNNAGATVQGGATLSGLGGTMAAIFTGKDSTTINNAGTINGSSNGYAITGDSGDITLNVTGGTASILGAITGGSGTNAMHLDPGTGNSFSYAGAISNFGSVEVKSGTVALSGASSSYSGTTTLTAGQLNVNNAAAIGTGTLVINAGALDNTTGSALTLSTNNALTINSDFEFKGSSDLNLGTGAVTLNANHIVTVDAGKLTIGGTLTSSQYQLTKAGAGTLVLNGTNNFSGPVTVSGGALSTSNVASLGTGTQVNIGSGSALQYTGTTATITQDITVTAGTGTIANTGGGTLTLTGTLNKNGTVLTLTGGVINANGAITGSSAGSDLVVDGATLNENAANSYNGPTFIRNAGTLNANVANALPTANGRSSVILDDAGSGGSKLALGADQSAAALTGAASSTVDLGGHSLTVGDSSGTTTYNGVITSSSGGILVKDGGSTLVLAGASTYSGGTQINAGTLSVTNTTGSATGSGSVMVNSGGTLNGTGTVGSVSVASGGTIAPGLDVGTLNVNGTLDLVSGSHLDYSFGSVSSLLNVSGALTYTGGGAVIFDIANNHNIVEGADYTLINYGTESGLSLANLAFGSTPGIFAAHFVIGANSLTLHVDAVPEPSRALLGALGLAFVALRRRRRLRKVATV